MARECTTSTKAPAIRSMPIEHGRVIGSMIPGSRLEILEGEAHGLVLVPRFVDRVVAHLAEPTTGLGDSDQSSFQ